jgi:hypothetical protein
LLHQEERRADVHGEEVVEVLERGLLDARRLRDAGVGGQDIEPVADNGAHPLGKRVRTVRLPQVGADLLGPAASLADFGDDGVGLLFAVAVVNQHLRACLCQSQGAGTADAARGAGNESGLSRKFTHGPIL